jgi:hypothetical protein
VRTAQARAQHFGFAAVGVLVALAAVLLPTRFAGSSGLLFFLNAVVGTLAGWSYGRLARAALAPPPGAAASVPTSASSAQGPE